MLGMEGPPELLALGGGEKGRASGRGSRFGCPREGGWSSRLQILYAVAERLFQTHDDGHLQEQVHHAATEMALREGQGQEVRPGREGSSGTGQQSVQDILTSSSFHKPARRTDFPG